MRSGWSRIAPAIVGAILVGCVSDVPEESGFEGDERPTFQARDPYEELAAVDWKRWSDEVLTSSKRPILLDLSGLWCHYCHIYDEFIYRTDAIASLIEKRYTPVRVDVDERPDIAQRYNQGGWPSLVVLTPEGYAVAGTGYHPDHAGAFLRAALERYEAGGDSLRAALAAQFEEVARRQRFLVETGELDPSVLEKVINGVSQIFDRDFGGFRPEEAAPKMAAPRILSTLIACSAEIGSSAEVELFLRRTLDRMASGGIRDHVFGGFFRAVDDRAWSLPHFEKLLDVQSGFADLYLAAFERFEEPAYRDIARETIEFVMEQLSNPDGVTFSNSIDGDLGPGDAGTYYTWSVAQVDSILTPEEAEAVKFYYGIAERGENPARIDQNTIFPHFAMSRLAEKISIDEHAARARIESARSRMRASRLAGARPRIDSRAFAGANLAFAATLLRASKALGEDAYRDRALALIDFFTQTHLDPTTGVPHVFDGRRVGATPLLASQIAGIEGLLVARALTGENELLERALQLHRLTAAAYRNEVTGVYWDVPSSTWGVGRLKVKGRPIDLNVRVAEALMDLASITGETNLRGEAEKVLTGFSVTFASSGLESVPYAVAVHRLFWKARARSS